VLADAEKLETPEKCLNCIKYLKTKVLRFLVSCVKSTQHSSREVYKLVPVENFSDSSDINWNLSISQIDAQLYKKYNLTDAEIEYIENSIKAME
jgi:hypothetical protein